jgi:hypothetical protein
MSFSQPLPTARFFCEECGRETRFLRMHIARSFAGVSRTTMYYWIQRNWVHSRELASGRRVVCQESLSRRAQKSNSDEVLPKRNPSRGVPFCSMR